MVSKDVVSFNAMIMGLTVNGEGEEALRLFSKMQEFGLQPNAGTFLGLLCACCHSGLAEKGRQIFVDMTSRSSVSLELEHYACYIDLLARVGLVEEEFEVVFLMPVKPNKFVWSALLGALRWLIREKGVKKQPGCSRISVNGVVHEFLEGSPSYPQIKSIGRTLNGLLKQMKEARP
ncbi:putative pentatricopeptide repeat-containing protein [Quercus suber]|uniref:Pentatricopeptide repeat-containing protein n=1 Tax=Quercus suber TaxID=58331 RepID=A0AAW0JTB7_QUESU